MSGPRVKSSGGGSARRPASATTSTAGSAGPRVHSGNGDASPPGALVQTAWAEGGVTQKERDLIVKAARSRGITAGSPADQQLDIWLAQRPSDELFEKTLRAIRTILQAQPAEAREASEKDLLSLATAIAAASGGIVGFRGIYDEERQILAHISDELKRSGKA